MSTHTRNPPSVRADATREQIRAYVAMLAGRPEPGELLELRYRVQTGAMARRFYAAQRPARLVEEVMRLGSRCDVFVGCAPRGRRAGDRDAVARSWVLWAECDTPAARDALEAFTPPPTVVIASGSPHGRHAYWALTASLTADAVEHANRRLAHALGADPVCVDAARILRPPGTMNFKRDRPAAVTALMHRPDRRYTLDELLVNLPDLPVPAAPGRTPVDRPRGGDSLLSVAPDEYVPVLLGRAIGRDRKVSCPFHSDSIPSLHAYSDHWFCFGCRTGGTIYDLAARIWRLDTRGPDFLELRARLQATFTR